ncbi:hypothetical protein VIAE109791_12695 [Vibrio aestuarianus subsp. francensis]
MTKFSFLVDTVQARTKCAAYSIKALPQRADY